jgi:hypothetical protein
MSPKRKLLVLKVRETDFEALLRKTAKYLRNLEEVRIAARPFAVPKKRSSAA